VQSFNTTPLLHVQVFSLIERIFLASIAEVAQNDASGPPLLQAHSTSPRLQKRRMQRTAYYHIRGYGQAVP
jgi:hypothetical protein